MPEAVYRFAEALRGLLATRSVASVEAEWAAWDVEATGWQALEQAWRRDVPAWERALDEVDGLLLRLLDRLPVLVARERCGAAHHLRTFRIPQLERLQHATAAALVAQRWGIAGLRTVIADQEAPLARRYFAFLALAERHPPSEWPLFARYLTPAAHHAFVGTAAEAARFYPETDAARLLVGLFRSVRSDFHLRAFLGPRILTSLLVLEDPSTLPFFRELLVAGHTHRLPERCEVTYALVAIQRMTGALEANAKYADVSIPAVREAVDQAGRALLDGVETITPVAVI